MLTHNFSEAIEVCSQVLADLQPNKDDPLASQATSFIEGALSMYGFQSFRLLPANIDP
jgi:hypothetical protein